MVFAKNSPRDGHQCHATSDAIDAMQFDDDLGTFCIEDFLKVFHDKNQALGSRRRETELERLARFKWVRLEVSGTPKRYVYVNAASGAMCTSLRRALSHDGRQVGGNDPLAFRISPSPGGAPGHRTSNASARGRGSPRSTQSVKVDDSRVRRHMRARDHTV